MINKPGGDGCLPGLCLLPCRDLRETPACRPGPRHVMAGPRTPLWPGLPVTESFAFRLVNALSEELLMFVYVLKKKPLWNINI